jgi:hypothetical protein
MGAQTTVAQCMYRILFDKLLVAVRACASGLGQLPHKTDTGLSCVAVAPEELIGENTANPLLTY